MMLQMNLEGLFHLSKFIDGVLSFGHGLVVISKRKANQFACDDSRVVSVRESGVAIANQNKFTLVSSHHPIAHFMN